MLLFGGLTVAAIGASDEDHSKAAIIVGMTLFGSSGLAFVGWLLYMSFAICMPSSEAERRPLMSNLFSTRNDSVTLENPAHHEVQVVP